MPVRLARDRTSHRADDERLAADVVANRSAVAPEILSPLWHVKARTARTLRLRLHAVLEWSIAMDYRTDNPCDRVGPVLGPQGTSVGRRSSHWVSGND